MILCLKAKGPVLIRISSPGIPVRKFHIASKILARSVSHRNQNNEVVEKNLENDSHPFSPQNSNVNFLGIEGDEGVITVTSKVSCLQEKTSTKQLREKFYKTSYGVIRYDTDNKLKFHGQYGKRDDFVFPYHSSDVSEVSRNTSKMKSKTLDKSFNDYNKSSIISAATESKSIYKNTDSEVQNKNSSKDSGEVSYIDQFYFEINSETENRKNTPTSNNSTDSLNYLDKQYFSHSTESENQNLLQTFSKNRSFNNEPNLKINTDIKEDNVSNPSSYSSTADFNFIDENYFKENNVSGKENSFHMGKISQNTDSFNSSYSEINYHNLSTENREENKAANLKDGQKPISKSNSTKDMSDNVLQSNIIARESYDGKQIDVKNLDRDLNMKQLDGNIFERNDETNSEFVVNNDLHSKRKNPLSDLKTNVSQDLNRNLYAANRNLSKSIKPQSERYTNDSAFSPKESTNEDTVRTAYDFVRNLQKQQEIPVQNDKEGGNKLFDMKLDSKGFRILKDQVQDLSHFTRDEILSLLKQSILYQDDNLLILNKPYSLVIHDSQTTKSPCLSSFLEDLAKEIDGKNINSKLVTVHRLDKETTGCLLIARNEITAQNLQSLFAQRKIIKKYWVLTSKVPDPPEGLIDIPISEGTVNNKKRMVLHPDIPKDIAYKNHSRKGKQALTSYKVLSEVGNAALVEATPITGLKHQIRVHFGFGLSCPIIGDHKYSHLDKLAPQKLPSDILQRLYIRQSKVRHVPLHIHAKSVTIPGYFDGRDLYIQAPLPNHMKENLKRLKFRKK